MLFKVKNFIFHDLWCMPLSSFGKAKGLVVKYLRIVVLALRGFAEDKCQLRASGLTFYTLLSIVPVVAMAFGIAKGFGFENMLERELLEKFKGQEEIVSRVVEFAKAMLNNTSGGLIAGIGIAILFWTVIKVLGNIEYSFNDIWGIKKGRPLVRKFSDYLSIMLLCPLLFILSSSLTIFIASKLEVISENMSLPQGVNNLIFTGVKIIPYVILWLLFSFVYIVMPNTKVKLGAGIFGGVLAGTLYQLMQWGYLSFQIGAAKYGAIYGSFAALPLFLIWLQVSWLIVLLGAELSYAYQNVDAYEYEPVCKNASRYFLNILALKIVSIVADTFVNQKEKLSAVEIASIIKLPIRLISEVSYELVEAGLLCRVDADDDDIKLSVGCDVSLLTLSYVLGRLDKKGVDVTEYFDKGTFDGIVSRLRDIEDAVKKLPSNVNVLKL